MADIDNDKMTAMNWSSADTASIDSLKLNRDNKVQLFEQIKLAVIEFIQLSRGTAKSDNKYIKIVNLLMQRVHAAITASNINSYNSDIIEDLADQIQKKFTDSIADILVNKSSTKLKNISLEYVQELIYELVIEGLFQLESNNGNNQFEENNSGSENKIQEQKAQDIANSDSSGIDEIYFNRNNITKEIKKNGIVINDNIQNTDYRLNTGNLSKSTNSSSNKTVQTIIKPSFDFDDIKNEFHLFKKNDFTLLTNTLTTGNFNERYVSNECIKFIKNIDAKILTFKFLGIEKIFHTLAPIKIKKQSSSAFFTEISLFKAIDNQLTSINEIIDNTADSWKNNSKKDKGKNKKIAQFGSFYSIINIFDNEFVNRVNDKVDSANNALKPIFAKNIKTLETVYKILKPKTIIERIMDWLKKKIIAHFMKGMFKNIISQLPIAKYFKGRLGPIYDSTIKPIVNRVKNTLKGIKSAFKLVFKGAKKVVSAIWKVTKKAFQKAVKGAVKLLKGLLKAIYNLAKGLGKMLWKAIKAIFRFLKNKLSGFLKKIAGKFKSFFKKFTGIFKKIGKFFSKIKKFFGKIGKFFKNLKNAIGKIFSKLKNVFNSVKQKIISAVKTVIQKITNAIKTVVKKVIEAVVKVVKTIITKIVKFFKKKLIQIFKKIGINFVKKKLKKKAAGFGMKLLIKFFTKWIVKFIAKLGVKVAAAAAFNVIPILGQIISICMMIYTIVDTLLMVWDIYKLFKENPALWDMVKEKVAEWADKAFSFFKDLAEWGKKLFNSICNFFKNAFHAAGDALFESNKIMNATREKCLTELARLQASERKRVKKLKNVDFITFFYNNLNKNYNKMAKLMVQIEQFNKKILEEDDATWRDTDAMTEWMLQRQKPYKELMLLLAECGIYGLRGFFDKNFVSDLRDILKDAKADLKKQLDERAKNAELERFKKLKLDYDAILAALKDLNKPVSERKEKLQQLNTFVGSEYHKIKGQLCEMYPALFDNDDEDEEEKEEDNIET